MFGFIYVWGGSNIPIWADRKTQNNGRDALRIRSWRWRARFAPKKQCRMTELPPQLSFSTNSSHIQGSHEGHALFSFVNKPSSWQLCPWTYVFHYFPHPWSAHRSTGMPPFRLRPRTLSLRSAYVPPTFRLRSSWMHLTPPVSDKHAWKVPIACLSWKALW